MQHAKPYPVDSSCLVQYCSVRSLAILLAAIMLGSASTAYALFCGSNVISEGASKPEVLRKCGDPTFAEQRVLYNTVYVHPGGSLGPHQDQVPRAVLPSPSVSGRGPQPQRRPADPRARAPRPHPAPEAFVPVYAPQAVLVAELIEEWIYNFGPHHFMYRLRFTDGVLRNITTLDYGY